MTDKETLPAKTEPKINDQLSLDLVTIEAMPYFKTIERADITEVGFDVSVLAQQIYAAIVSKINPSDSDIANVAYRITPDEIRKMTALSIKNFKRDWDSALDELHSCKLHFTNVAEDLTYITKTGLIAEHTDIINTRTKAYEGSIIKLPTTLHKYLCKFSKNNKDTRFISTELRIATQLVNSKYTLKIYKILKKYSLPVIQGKIHQKVVMIDLDELRHYLSYPKSYSFQQLLTKTIFKALAEINKKTELYVEYLGALDKSDNKITGKRGQVAKTISFTIVKNKNAPPAYTEALQLDANQAAMDIFNSLKWSNDQISAYGTLMKEFYLKQTEVIEFVSNIDAAILKDQINTIQIMISSHKLTEKDDIVRYSRSVFKRLSNLLGKPNGLELEQNED